MDKENCPKAEAGEAYRKALDAYREARKDYEEAWKAVEDTKCTCEKED